MLEYLGADCTVADDTLVITMPKVTLWEAIIPNIDSYKTAINIEEESGVEKAVNVTLGVLADVVMNPGDFFATMFRDTGNSVTGNVSDDSYMRDVLYSIVSIDPFNYQSVVEEASGNNEEMTQFLKDSASVYGLSSEVYSTAASKFLKQTVTNADVYKEVLARSDQIEQLGIMADAAVFTFDVSSTINERLQYDENSCNVFENVLNDDVFSYANYTIVSDWTKTAEQITKELDSKEEIQKSVLVEKSTDQFFEMLLTAGADAATKGGLYSVITESGKELLRRTVYKIPWMRSLMFTV